MTRHDLRNALCALNHIDRSYLVGAGVIEHGDGKAWQTFASNPERFFLRLDDERAEKLWGLIEGRMQPRPLYDRATPVTDPTNPDPEARINPARMTVGQPLGRNVRQPVGETP